MKILDTIEQLKLEVPNIIGADYLVFDIETTGLIFTDDILSIQLKTPVDSYYLPFDTIPAWRIKSKEGEQKTNPKKTETVVNQLSAFDTKEFIKMPEHLIDKAPDDLDFFKEAEEIDHEFLNLDVCRSLISAIFNSDINKIGHGMKFDIKNFMYHKIEFKNWYFDTMLAAWTIKEDRLSYKLKDLYPAESGNEVQTFKQLIGKNEYWELTNAEMITYAMHDCDYTEFLYLKYKPLIEAEFKVFFKTQMMDVCEVLTTVDMNGVAIDEEYGNNFVETRKEVINKTYLEIQAYLSDNGFNPDMNLKSPKQMSEFFFDTLKYTFRKRTVDKHALAHWENKGSKIAKMILDYRHQNDILKFMDPDKPGSIMANLNPITDRVHTSFNQHRTVMHRLSSSKPNLQNPPREEGIRDVIIAPPGRKLFFIDYSQIELRCFAHYSQDPRFLEAYTSEDTIDIHELTRKNIIEPLFPTRNKKEQRSLAKNVNFGIWYGITAKGLANMLACKEYYGNQILDSTFEYYNVNAEWILKVHRWVHDNKWVGNMYGGKRRFPNFDFNQKNEWKVKYIYKEAVHFIISGTAACILKAKQVNLHRDLQLPKRDDVKMIIPVHDELIFDIDENYDTQEIVEIMEAPEPGFSIPLVTESKTADRWLSKG